MKRLLNSLLLMILPFIASAQEVEMAELLRSSGKIYVVVGVIAIIFIGLVVYLITIDRRLTKMEKNEK